MPAVNRGRATHRSLYSRSTLLLNDVLALGLELGFERVEPPGDRGVRAVEQRTVVTLDHPHARAHDASELEHGHARGERVRRERVAARTRGVLYAAIASPL